MSTAVAMLAVWNCVGAEFVFETLDRAKCIELISVLTSPPPPLCRAVLRNLSAPATVLHQHLHVFIYEGRDPKVQLGMWISHGQAVGLLFMRSECLTGNGLRDL